MDNDTGEMRVDWLCPARAGALAQQHGLTFHLCEDPEGL
jgi:hypothetical protein